MTLQAKPQQVQSGLAAWEQGGISLNAVIAAPVFELASPVVDDLGASSLARSEAVLAIIRLALSEDIGRGDITTESTVGPDVVATAEVLQKRPGVVCGLPVMATIFATLDPRIEFRPLVAEGSWGDRRVVARVSGPARPMLSAERTALNFVQRLSGVATASRRAADAASGTSTRVIDTRKTTPGMRVLEKYAVRVGGCYNHRGGLDDCFLIKENHIRAAGGIRRALEAARRRMAPAQLVQIEVTSLDELEEAINAGAQLILLDNFDVAGLRAAVQRAAGRARLEASGGVTLENLPEIARTGVDFASIGALTHSAGVVDFSLNVVL
jgi:nicotinate-nucleotide pyrophosphorylase (carboxylating)